MDDREMLRLAALAAGITDGVHCEMIGGGPALYSKNANLGIWSPLTDDGDALRLAVKLHIHFRHMAYFSENGNVQAGLGMDYFDGIPYQDDPYAATRRAIVRAAAAIGEQKGM